MVGKPDKGEWILIDAGMPNSGEEVLQAVEKKIWKK